ncbi:MAG TPA: PAS domain S-box protein [Anaerolinea sp.]|nr:PAS domain S-box protein [Anaerolinea sp.]
MNSKEKPGLFELRQANPGIWVGLFFVIVALLIAGGIWFYNSEAQNIRNQKNSELRAIAALKIGQITQWREERLGDALFFSSSPAIQTGISLWLSSPEDPAPKSALNDQLGDLIHAYKYQNAILVTADGSMLLAGDPQSTEIFPETQRLIQQALTASGPIMGDFFANPTSGQVWLEFAAAISNPDGLAPVVLILRVDPNQYLYPLVQTWPTPSQSAETLLVRKDGNDVLYLNTLRHDPTRVLTIRIPLTRLDLPAVQAILGKTGGFEGVDYRGERVLSELSAIPGTAWFMVAKVDQAEMLAEIMVLGRVILLVVVLSILMTAALAAYLFNRGQRRLYQSLYLAESQQLKAQEEIRTTLYSIGDAIITTDQDGLITRLNPVAEKLTGWSEQEAAGLPLEQVFRIVNEFNHQPVENPVTRVLREGLVVNLANHTLLISRSGKEYPIADSGAPINAENGQILGVVLVFRDQTKEREEQHTHDLLTDTLSASLNEIFMFDGKTLLFRYVNQGALNNLGYPLEKMQKMTPLDIKPLVTRQAFNKILQPLIDHEKQVQVFETMHRRANGSLYPAEVHLQLFDQNDDPIFLAVIQDISERRRSEAALRKSEAFLNETQQLTRLGGWEWDQRTNTITWSDETYRIHGMQPGEIPPGSLEHIARSLACFSPADRPNVQEALEACLSKGKPFDLQAAFTSTTGEKKFVRMTGKAEWEEGQIVRINGAIMDITVEQAFKRDYQLLFQEMLEAFALHTIICDEAGRPVDYRFEAVNPAYERLTGLKAEDIIGKTVLQVLPGTEPYWIETYGRVAQTGEPAFFENYSKDLGHYYEVTAFRPAPDQFACIFTDTTRRKQAEIQLDEQLDELRRWQQVMLGRETRIMDLKLEVNQLLEQAGQPPRYTSMADGQDE